MRALAGSTAVYGAADIAGRALTFVGFLVLANLLDVADFGLVALLASLAAFIGMFGNLGISSAVQRHYFERGVTDSERVVVVSTGMLLLVLAAGFAALAVVAASELFGEFLAERYGLTPIYLLLSGGIAITAQLLSYVQDVLRARFEVGRFAVVAIARNAATLALAVLLIAAAGLGVAGYLWGVLAGTALLIPLGLAFIRRELGWRFSRNAASKLVAFGVPLVGAGIGTWIMASADLWLLGSMVDAKELGLYGIAVRFASVLVVLNAAFGQAWAPFALAAHASDPNYRDMVGRFFSYWFYLLTLAGVALALFASELLMIFTPLEYWSAAAPLGLLAMGAVFLGTTQVTVLGLSLEKRTGLIAACAWAAALINVALNLALIPSLGATGAAWANALSFLTLTLLYLLFAQRYHPLPLPRAKLGMVLAMLLLGMLVANRLNAAPVTPLVVGVKVCVLVALLAAGLMAGIYKPVQLRRAVASLGLRRR